MKFKYMIRGLGLGVVITAAVMGAYSRNAVADARVAVLREYGFGEESRLVEGTDPSSETLSEEMSAADMTDQAAMRDEEREEEIDSVLDAAREAEGTVSGEVQDPSSDADASDADVSDVESSSPESSSVIVVTPSGEGVDDVIEIVIASGDDSGTVARKLYNAGLIGNASEYDAYLMQHGYDKRLSTGTKTINLSDSWQEIADKITR